MHRRMLLIRGFEQRVSRLFRDGEVPGLRAPVDRAGGGGRRRLLAARPTDVITSTHRGHGHCLAKGLDPLGMFAELMAQGRRHQPRAAAARCTSPIPKLGIFGANGIVAAGLPIAVGAAAASQLRADGSVAVSFFGDGAVAHGAFHEAVNLAAVWQLPVIFFCENNGYAEFSPAATQHAAPLELRAAGLRDRLRRGRRQRRDARPPPSWPSVVEAVRAGGGPVLVEATTYRWHGHYEGDPRALPDAGRGAGVGGARSARRARERLRAAGAARPRSPRSRAAVEPELDEAVDAARRSRPPDASHP